MMADSSQVKHRHSGVPDHEKSREFETTLRSAIAAQLGEPRFSLWFGEGVRLDLSGDGDTVRVRVPSAFFREWIRDHFSSNLLEAAQHVTGRQVQLSFAIEDEADPLIGDVVEPDVEHSPERPGETIVIPLPGHHKTPLTSPLPLPGLPTRFPAPRFEPPASDQSEGRNLISRLGRHSIARGEAARMPLLARPARRLDDFMTGSSNRLAHAAAHEMIVTAGRVFNPLVIHGGVGLGKTHLLEAITHGLRVTHPNLNVLLITAEAFTNSFLEAMRAGTLSSFRSRYRGLGALAVDDVHFLAGTRATQSEFLHTFNSLLERGAPIVLTTDQHPRRISRLTDELVTRFLGGMIVKLETPELAVRRAILQSKSAARGVDVPVPVVDYIAEHLRASVRELEGALHSVIAHALLTGRRLDLALAKSALRDTIRHTTPVVGIREVESAVCQLFQVETEALRSDSRARALAYPRMLAMYLARKHTGAAYSEIGRHFGGRNHSTVISAEHKVQAWLKDEQQIALLPGFESVADLLADLERTLGT